MDDLKLAILSDKNSLTDLLTEKFNGKYIGTDLFSLTSGKSFNDYNYLIINLYDTEFKSAEIINIVKDLNIKTILLFPLYVQSNQKQMFVTFLNNVLKVNNNVVVLLIPELIGGGVKYNENYFSHNIVYQSINSDRVRVDLNNKYINTVSIQKLSEVIIRQVFSFGSTGKSVAIFGPRRSSGLVVKDYLKIKKENIINYKGDRALVEMPYNESCKVFYSVKFSLFAFKKSLNNEVSQNVTQKINVLSNTKVDKIPSGKKERLLLFVKNLFTLLIVLVVCLLVVPLFFSLISAFFIYMSYINSKTNLNLAYKYLDLSSKTVSVAQATNLGIPAYFEYSNIIYKTNQLFSEVLDIASLGSDLVSNIVGKRSYDLNFYSDNLASLVDKVIYDLRFIQSDINEIDGVVGYLVDKYFDQKGLNAHLLSERLFFVRDITSRISTLLGMESQRKYLVLFQNNMELRPTGGFIGSFALITFDKGIMSEIVVNDVYSADGQLKGHVEPPEPIRRYLGEGGWYLRDSNWDPDFLKSADKAEWFLDKELDVKVDGVISIDLSFVKKLLKIIGPITLKDFNVTITPDNLYSTTQSEVESNFFPGSIKKAGFMSALSKQLILELESLSRDKYPNLIKTLYESLEARHIQIYLHDLNAQKSFESLGYSGSVNMDVFCGQRCIEDKYAYVDSNLGVNKANFYISKNQNLNVRLKKNFISHSLIVDYVNNSSQAIGNEGLYKAYPRVILPKEAIVKGIRIINSDGSYQDLNYDLVSTDNRQDVGFYVEIIPSTKLRIQIDWDIRSDSLAQGGEYRLNIRKQSGVDSDGLQVFFDQIDLFLTGRVPSVYTTTLDKDFKIKLFLK